MKVKIEMLESKSFEPYGDVIGPQKSKPAIAADIIDFWPGISDIKPSADVIQMNWLELKKPRPFICESMERHILTTEAIIPVSGQSIILFGLSEDMSDINSPIDYKSLKAFIIDGTKAFNIKKGVWHDLPFLLTEKAECIVIFEKQTHEKDLETVQLKEKIELALI